MPTVLNCRKKKMWLLMICENGFLNVTSPPQVGSTCLSFLFLYFSFSLFFFLTCWRTCHPSLSFYFLFPFFFFLFFFFVPFSSRMTTPLQYALTGFWLRSLLSLTHLLHAPALWILETSLIETLAPLSEKSRGVKENHYECRWSVTADILPSADFQLQRG